MSDAVESGEVDAWDRFAWQLPTATTVLLAVSTAVAVIDSHSGRPIAAVIGLAIGFGAWQAAWRPWRRNLESTPAASIVWGIGTIAIWAALTTLHPAFYLLLFVMFSLLFTASSLQVASGLAVVLSVAVAAVNVRGTTDAGTAAGVVFVALVGGVIAVVFGRWIHGIIEQSRERGDLIAELEATRDELAAAERASGALNERARLAAEIHDTLAQGFTSIVLLLEAVRAGVRTDAGRSHPIPDPMPDATLRRLELAIDTARENLAEARHLVADLGPAALADTSLPDALRRATADLGVATGATVSVAIDGVPRRLQTDQEVAILRVAQESLANVRRHSAARTVTVRLGYGVPDGASLSVVDDGRGFDLETAPDGFGLKGMAERLSPLGGDLHIESTPGRGTRVEARLP